MRPPNEKIAPILGAYAGRVDSDTLKGTKAQLGQVDFRSALRRARGQSNDIAWDWYSGAFPYKITPLDGIKNKIGPGVKVNFVSTQNKSAIRIQFTPACFTGRVYPTTARSRQAEEVLVAPIGKEDCSA
jgi:hypothetical protein